MAQEVLVTDALSQEMIQAGDNVLRQLIKDKLPLRGAMWFYFDSAEKWRLMLVFSNVKTEGPGPAYDKVLTALSRMKDNPAVGLKDITVADARDPLVKALQSAVRGKHPTRSPRITREMIDGHYIDDAYVYDVP